MIREWVQSGNYFNNDFYTCYLENLYNKWNGGNIKLKTDRKIDK